MAISRVTGANALSAAGATSNTCTPNGSGSNLYGLAFVTDDDNDTVTGVTWGGTSMTQLAKIGRGGATSGAPMIYAYGLFNPASGSQNVVASRSGTFHKIGVAAELLSGAQQSTTPDATAVNSATPGGTTITGTLTAVANGCAMYAFGGGDNGLGTPSNGTGLQTAIVNILADAQAVALCQSTTFPLSSSGSQSGTINVISNGAPMILVVTIAPIAGAAVNSGFLAFM